MMNTYLGYPNTKVYKVMQKRHPLTPTIPTTGYTVPESVIPATVATVEMKSSNEGELEFVVEKKSEIESAVLGFVFENKGSNTTGKYVRPFLNSDFVLCSEVIDDIEGSYVSILKFTCTDESKSFYVFAEDDILKKEEII